MRFSGRQRLRLALKRARGSTSTYAAAHKSPHSRGLSFEVLEDRCLLSVSFNGSYSQNFDTLPTSGTNLAWTNDSTLPGWSLFRQPALGTAVTSINAGNGASNAGSFYSFGSTGSTDRALGGVGSGGSYFGSPAAGATAGWIGLALVNKTGAPIYALDLHFDAEQWRNGGNTSAQTMTLEYNLYNIDGEFQKTYWVEATANFEFTSLANTGNATALDGNAPANRASLGGILPTPYWQEDTTLWIRWAEQNDLGNDHGLAIDNVTITTRSAIVVSSGNDSGPGTLREAIAQASVMPGEDTIIFLPSGLGVHNVAIDSPLVINDSSPLNIVGPGRIPLEITGGGDTNLIVAHSPLSISGLELSSGQGTSFGIGTAIDSDSSLTINTVQFNQNVSYWGGGAVHWNGGSGETLRIQNSSFVGNFATAKNAFGFNGRTGGSALYINMTANAAATITTCEFSSNTSTSIVPYNEFYDWSANGGAIDIFATDASSVQIVDSYFSNNKTVNTAYASLGGAIYAYVESAAQVSVSACKFAANNFAVDSPSVVGGAIAVEVFNQASFSIDNSLFYENQAGGGGALYVGGTGGSVKTTNNTFTSNSATVGGAVGGAIWYTSTGGTMSIDHTTIQENSAGNSGGGVYASTPGLTIENSIIAENTDLGGNTEVAHDLRAHNPTTVVRYSLIGDNRGTNRGEAPIGSPDSSGNLIGGPGVRLIDPLLAPLYYNGGPLPTFRLLPGSPAINAGDPNYAGPLSYDQRARGYARAQAGRTDMGAYEVQTPARTGDYNLSSVVEASDYVLWRNSQNSLVTPFTSADGDGNGVVNQGDYTAWRANFGKDSSEFTISNGLLGYWKFDGDGTDDAGLQEALDLSGGVGFAGGLFGQALDLHHNSAQYASRSVNDTEFDFGVNGATVQIWANFNSVSGAQVLIEKFTNDTGPGWTVSKLSANQLLFYSNSSFQILATVPTIVPGTWHQLVIRNTSKFAADLYYDGHFLQGITNSGGIGTSTNGLLIGKRNSGDAHNFGVDGRIDEVAIWDRPLSEEEISLLWNGGAGRDILAPVAGGGGSGSAVAAELSAVVSTTTLESGSINSTANSYFEPFSAGVSRSQVLPVKNRTEHDFQHLVRDEALVAGLNRLPRAESLSEFDSPTEIVGTNSDDETASVEQTLDFAFATVDQTTSHRRHGI